MTPKRPTGCDRCVDGWRIVETADGSSYATRCDCFTRTDEERRLRRAGVSEGLLHCNFDSFDVMHDGQRMALRVAQDFVDTYPLSGPTGLLFHGPPGTGKTHLMVAILRALVLQKGVRVQFLDFRRLLKTIQESWNSHTESSEKQVFDSILETDVLALDDLGAEKPSRWVRETIGYIINERYVRARPVLISTNLVYDPGAGEPDRRPTRRLARDEQPSDSLSERIGAAALSRLVEMCKPLDMTRLPDFRREVKLFGTNKFSGG